MTGSPAATDQLPSRRPLRMLRAARATAVPVLLALVISAGASGPVRVKRGDTLWSLAQRHHTTVGALRELNGIPGNSSTIYAGTLLEVPGPRAAPSRAPAPRHRTVVRGDSLIKIARRYGRTTTWISRKNHLPPSGVVILGDRLIVGTTTGTATRPGPGPRRHASRERVRVLVRAEALRAGVDPELALALAYLESGFQHDVVSGVGAVGVMQVMPGTGRWVSRYLVGRPLDLHDDEDNVVAGVRYLALLIRITGRPAAALAGYYQGLESVRHNGTYSDTKQYVANVLAIQRRLEQG